MHALIGLLLLMGLMALLVTLQGFVISYLWYWFMVPLGVHPISVAHAIGLALLVGTFTYSSKASSPNADEEKIGQYALIGIIVPLLMLLLGRIVHTMM